jgi:acyl carrier protein
MQDKICEIIAKALEVQPELVTLKTTSNDIDDWDSLGHLTILMELGAEFGSEIEGNTKLASAVSVQEIIDIIAES